jgi:hypothetical protein
MLALLLWLRAGSFECDLGFHVCDLKLHFPFGQLSLQRIMLELFLLQLLV